RDLLSPRRRRGRTRRGRRVPDPLLVVALSLGTAAIVLVALLFELSRPWAAGALRSARAALRARRRPGLRGPAQIAYDPRRGLRAEHRARELLRSCVDPEGWAMYRDLRFLRVLGTLG